MEWAYLALLFSVASSNCTLHGWLVMDDHSMDSLYPTSCMIGNEGLPAELQEQSSSLFFYKLFLHPCFLYCSLALLPHDLGGYSPRQIRAFSGPPDALGKPQKQKLKAATQLHCCSPSPGILKHSILSTLRLQSCIVMGDYNPNLVPYASEDSLPIHEAVLWGEDGDERDGENASIHTNTLAIIYAGGCCQPWCLLHVQLFW